MTNLKSSIIDKLTTKNTDMHGRRTVNAAASVDSSDYTTQKEVRDLIDDLTTQLNSLQKQIGNTLGVSVPLELISIHPNIANATDSQLVIGDTNVDRNNISLLSYGPNNQYIAFGAKFKKGVWIATDTDIVYLYRDATGISVYTSMGNTIGAAMGAATLSGQFLYNSLFALNTGPSVNKIETTIHNPGVDTSIPTEKAVRSLVAGFTGTFTFNDYALSGNLIIGYTLSVSAAHVVTVDHGLIQSVT